MNNFNLREWIGKGTKNLLKEEAQGPELPTVRDITFRLITDVFIKAHIHNSPTIGDRPFTLTLEMRAPYNRETFDSVVKQLGVGKDLDNLTINDIMDRNDNYIRLAQEISAIFYQKMIFDEFGKEYTIPQEAVDFKILSGENPLIKDLSAEEIAHKFGIPLQMLKDFNLDPEFLSGDRDTVEISSAFHDFLHDMLLGVMYGDPTKKLQLKNFKIALQKATGIELDYLPNFSEILDIEVSRLWKEINSKLNLINVETQTEVPYQPPGEESVPEAVYHIIVPYLIPVEFTDNKGINLASKMRTLSGDFEVKGFSFTFDTYSGVKLNFDRENITFNEKQLIQSILSQDKENLKKQTKMQDDDENVDDDGRDSISKSIRTSDDSSTEEDPLDDFTQDAIADLFQ